ncbi:hypothetical protein ACRAWB_03585 [Leifsonia poae]
MVVVLGTVAYVGHGLNLWVRLVLAITAAGIVFAGSFIAPVKREG